MAIELIQNSKGDYPADDPSPEKSRPVRDQPAEGYPQEKSHGPIIGQFQQK